MSTEDEEPEEEENGGLDVDDLDSTWDELDENEQQEILDSYDEADGWNDFNPEEKFAILQDRGHIDEDAELADDPEDTGPEWDPEDYDVDLDIDELAVESDLELVGNYDTTVTVDGIPVDGAREVTMSGEGYESQYLREIDSGGGGDANDYGFDEPSDDGDGDGGDEDSGEGDGSAIGDEGEEPPLHIEIIGTMAQPHAQALVELRNEDQPFGVTVFDEAYDDMELHEFRRTLSGENPYSYEVRIELVEWREVEVDVDGEGGWDDEYGLGDGDDGDSEDDGDAEDPADEAEDAPEGGDPDDPEEVSMDPGEERNFRLDDGEDVSNVVFDTSEDGAGSTLLPRGDGWRATDLAWDAEENISMIASKGSGYIRNIFMGHFGDAGIICEDATRVDIGDVNLQNSQNGIRVVEGDIEDAVRPGERAPMDGLIVSLLGWEDHTDTFTWAPPSDGNYRLTVRSEDDSDSVVITSGGAVMTPDGGESVTLSPGSSHSGTLTWTAGSAGTHKATVETDDDSDSVWFEVE